ncbi:hypothetical protein M0R88_05185 [Halorussus gelatinilyticus]|uniref:DUF7344 domain-containing protein n=1 Tax=Halorussus gelatinilyticus TaxID=2937524 RepID=A0A8U0INB3_9EURY|nr:hypothetical protein [Halorussus gelatinilyticus]UPW01499.1 hypothetical protein M0R88_05185 [Halorussus gelatinilyticus]
MRDDLAEGNETPASPTPSPREPSFEAPPLSQDNIFDALSSKRSRYVLVALREAEGPIDLRELVDTVAAWETNKPIDLVSEEHCKRVFTSLRHSQLPKLAMMGLVEYDETDEVVERGPYAEQADAYLDIAASRDENVDL